MWLVTQQSLRWGQNLQRWNTVLYCLKILLMSSRVEEDGEIREGEGWFPGQGAACVTARGAWWGCRGSGFLATPRCRGNKTGFINLAGARKVMTGFSAHKVSAGIWDGSDAGTLLNPHVKEHFNSERWILLPKFWLILGLNLLLLFTLFLLKTVAHQYVLKENIYLIVTIFLSNNHLLTYLELQN